MDQPPCCCPAGSGEKFKGGRAAESDPVWLPVSADPRCCEQLTKEKMHITIEVGRGYLEKESENR